MKSIVVSFTLAAGLINLIATSTTRAAPKIEEAVVAPAWMVGTVFTLSPSGMHFASKHPKGDKFVITLDGVTGEPFDEIYNAAIGFEVKFTQDGFALRSTMTWTGPVAFSPDGTRHAYAGRKGQDIVVMLDGKEVFRAPASSAKSPANNLFFSPDGKHLFFHNQTSDSNQSYRLIVDGAPATPPFEGAQFPIFSRDGSRWALAVSKPGQGNVTMLVIDGKEAGYSGERLQFTPDNKHLVCVAGARPKQSLLVDGKAMVSGEFIEKFAISSIGDIGAIVNVSAGRNQFFINGKLIADTTSDFVFSPNGKRWAAISGINRAFTVIVDGTKQPNEYTTIVLPQFSPDSSKYFYIVERGTKQHVVIDGKEDVGHTLLHYRPVFSRTGHGLMYTGGDMMGKLRVYYNEHVEPIDYRLSNQMLSPDGTRFAYTGQGGTGDPNYIYLIVDREVKKDARIGGAAAIHFSPDSKHLTATLHQGLWFDDQIIKITRTPLGFTNDSRNLIFVGRETAPQGQIVDAYYLNGDLVARFSTKGTQFAGGRPKAWEEQSDGRIVFVGNDVEGLNDLGLVKRITVTPDPAGDARTWVGEVKANEEKAIADAAAAKQKSETDAATAAAKKKADYEAAVAAKAKARQDAADAKAKARADAAAAKAKK